MSETDCLVRGMGFLGVLNFSVIVLGATMVILICCLVSTIIGKIAQRLCKRSQNLFFIIFWGCFLISLYFSYRIIYDIELSRTDPCEHIQYSN